MIWEEFTSFQIKDLDKHIPVLINLSATEQHGRHLPLGTDRMIGHHFCQRLNEKIGDKVLILPELAIGYSKHHMDFAGTLSLNHETILAQLKDITDAVFSHGFYKFVLFNSHGGNQGLGQVFIEKMGARYPHGHFVMFSWFRLAVERLRAISDSGPGGAGHGGEFETSLMLRIAPHLVNQEYIGEKRNKPSFRWAEGDLFGGGEASYYRSMMDMTDNGIYGDPRFASTEKGEQIENVVLDRMKEIVFDLYNLDTRSLIR